MPVMPASSADPPNPGCSGRYTENFSVQGAANSQPPAVPPPCQNTSGSPCPARNTCVLTPLTTSSCDVHATATSAHSRGSCHTRAAGACLGPRRGVARSRGARGSLGPSATQTRDDFLGEQRHVLDHLPVRHVADVVVENHARGAGALA